MHAAAAFGILSVLTVAAITVHAQIGFFMNWSGTQADEGFEFHVLAGALALALVVRGGGALSLDRRIGHNRTMNDSAKKRSGLRPSPRRGTRFPLRSASLTAEIFASRWTTPA